MSCGFVLLIWPFILPFSPCLLCRNHSELLSLPSQTSLIDSPLRNSVRASPSAWNSQSFPRYSPGSIPLSLHLSAQMSSAQQGLPSVLIKTHISLSLSICSPCSIFAPSTFFPPDVLHAWSFIYYSLPPTRIKLHRVGTLAISFLALSPSPGTVPELGITGKGSGGNCRQMIQFWVWWVLSCILDIPVDVSSWPLGPDESGANGRDAVSRIRFD